MELTPLSCIKVNPNAILTVLDNGEGVLLNLDSKRYYTLNETGVFLWKHINGKKNIEEIAIALYEDYDVSKTEALNATIKIFTKLANHKLIQTKK